MSPMAVTSKAMRAVLVALALSLAGSLVWGFYQHGRAKVLATENNALEADLAALSRTVEVYEAEARKRVQADSKQATARAKQAQAVRATRDELKKEEADAQEPRHAASPDQLDRLRRLAEAGNASIRAASELP